MSETAAILVDEVLPWVPVRQRVLPLPVALRYLLATRRAEITRVLGVVWRAIALPPSLSTSDCGVNWNSHPTTITKGSTKTR
jgi:hypothetical protein